MSVSIAAEAKRIVFDAASPIAAGETIKAQLRRSWSNLDRPAYWRVRAAWYGEAGCWSASALEDLRARYSRWLARQQQKQEAKLHAETTLLRAQVNTLKAQLMATDPLFYSAEIDRLEWQLRSLSDQGVTEEQTE